MTDSGYVVLNTRPKHQAGELSELLIKAGLSVVELPLLEVRYCLNKVELLATLSNLSANDCLVFTSVNSVLAVAELSLARFRGIAIGKKTADALSRLGVSPDFVGSGEDSRFFARELTDYLKKRSSKNELPTIVWIRGDSASRDFAKLLQHEGFTVNECVVYQSHQVELPVFSWYQLLFSFGYLSDKQLLSLTGQSPIYPHLDLVLITSTQAAKHFYHQLNQKMVQQAVGGLVSKIENLPIAALGKRTTEELRRLGFKQVFTAAENNIESLAALALNWVNGKE